MRHVRMLGLCLAAVLALGAYAVSSASALPEFGRCEAKTGGKYEDSSCTVKAKGKTGKHEYEWKKVAAINAGPNHIDFEGGSVGSGGVLRASLSECHFGEDWGRRVTRAACEKAGGEVELEAETPVVECESEVNEGEITGSNTVSHVTVTFSGCKLYGSLPCSNTPTGKILVNTLKGKLGYIDKAEKKVGILLEPEKKHGEFAKFQCGFDLDVGVGAGNSKEGAFYLPESKGGDDGIISPISPVNTMSETFEQVYSYNGSKIEPENVPTKFEGGNLEVLESYMYPSINPGEGSLWSPSSEEITNVNKSCEINDFLAYEQTECEENPVKGEIKA